MKLRITLSLFMMLLLTGCGGGGGNNNSTTTTPVVDDGDSRAIQLEIPLPTEVLNVGAVDMSKLKLSVVLNGTTLSDFSPDESRSKWSKEDANLLTTNDNTIVATWSENGVTGSNGKSLILGESSYTRGIGADDESLLLPQTTLNRSFDEDADGYDNLKERGDGTNPFAKNTVSGDTTLSSRLTIPNIAYGPDLKVSASWGGKAIPLNNNGRVYTGTISQLTASTASFKAYIKSGSFLVAEYIDNNFTVNSGENTKAVSEPEFKLRPISVTSKAKIPTKDYRGSYVVRVKGLSGNSFTNMDGSSQDYNKSFSNVSLGSKTVEFEIRSKSNDDYLWATAKKTFQVKAGSNTVSVSASDFNFSIDSDGDGTNNIDDPDPHYVEVVISDIDVYIPYTYEAPTIDGDPYDYAWDYAIAYDRDDSRLWIDNLMIEKRSNPGIDNDDHMEDDGAPNHYWKAMYDDEYLYLLVYSVNDLHNQHDSQDAWDDDDLNIYWDGNNSKGSSYDGVDDFHVLIPFLSSNGDQNVNGRRLQGSESANLPSGNDLRFATKIHAIGGGDSYDYHDVYEVRIKLSKAKIEIGRPFGIDIHLDDDDDGGDRDQKWGWYHKSRNGSDVDGTYKKPSLMGTAILE